MSLLLLFPPFYANKNDCCRYLGLTAASFRRASSSGGSSRGSFDSLFQQCRSGLEQLKIALVPALLLPTMANFTMALCEILRIMLVAAGCCCCVGGGGGGTKSKTETRFNC
jgi:hypothetical protein